MVMEDSKSEDDKRRDEILKRMLNTPHKPHVPLKPKTKKARKPKKERKG
jgi:hypothetical protein